MMNFYHVVSLFHSHFIILRDPIGLFFIRI